MDSAIEVGFMVMKIVVIGMGYVGIPAAGLLAEVDGFDVTGLQRRSKRSGWKIDHLNAGKSPFEGDEPGLDELIAKVVEKGTFRVTDDVEILSVHLRFFERGSYQRIGSDLHGRGIACFLWHPNR